METLEELTQAIMSDEQNKAFTEKGIKPLFTIPKTARINIVGQAPGIRAQESGLYWNDPSGDNLRDWMGVSREEFYESGMFAIVPMDFYFPGHGKSGDLPPRKGFADKWHEKVLALAPDIQLKNYKDYLPEFFPLVHPSPRNNIWQAKNPWFMEEVVPDLKALVKKILSQ